MCDLNLRGTASGEESLLLDQRADGAVGVVQRALGLVQNERVGSAADNGNSVNARLDARNLDVTCA